MAISSGLPSTSLDTNGGRTNGGRTVTRAATWRRVDLHLHTPGVDSFRSPDGADLESEAGRAAVVKHYVARLVESGIDVAAIIDYKGIRAEWNEYRPLDKRSVGRRATAILLPLFALEGGVLLLDQPEGDLDNRFVYEDVVQILRDQKGLDEHPRRQVIAATHNANIPVIGDAELILPLQARGSQTAIAHRGSIDDGRIREEVKTIMEGGEEAFRLRSEKYGGLRGEGWS